MKGNKGRTKEECQTEAKKYTCRSDFDLFSPGYYNRARKQGWLEECCAHMVWLIKSPNRTSMEPAGAIEHTAGKRNANQPQDKD